MGDETGKPLEAGEAWAGQELLGDEPSLRTAGVGSGTGGLSDGGSGG